MNELYARSLAQVALEDAMDPALIGAMATADVSRGEDDTTSVADARSKKVDAFAALLVLLFGQLQRGTITEAEYLAKVGDAFDAAIGDIPAGAEATIARLRDKAIARAQSFAAPAKLPSDSDDAPSDAQKKSWGQMVAGALWAASIAAVVLAGPKDKVWEWESQEDPAVCEDCDELDGQTFFLSDIQFWPGESDFGESLPDGSQCGPNCRCKMKESSA